MKRRKAIQGIILFTLGGSTLYSCKDEFAVIKKLSLPDFKWKDKELDNMKALSEFLLPISTIPELADHTTLPFIVTMAHDTLDQKNKDRFISGYQLLGEYAETSIGRPMSQLTEEEKRLLIEKLRLGGNDEKYEGVEFLADYVRGKNIQYLTTSQFFLEKFRDYEMAPGFYEECVPIKETI